MTIVNLALSASELPSGNLTSRRANATTSVTLGFFSARCKHSVPTKPVAPVKINFIVGNAVLTIGFGNCLFPPVEDGAAYSSGANAVADDFIWSKFGTCHEASAAHRQPFHPIRDFVARRSRFLTFTSKANRRVGILIKV
jgi:hypothetical protein